MISKNPNIIQEDHFSYSTSHTLYCNLSEFLLLAAWWLLPINAKKELQHFQVRLKYHTKQCIILIYMAHQTSVHNIHNIHSERFFQFLQLQHLTCNIKMDRGQRTLDLVQWQLGADEIIVFFVHFVPNCQL